MGKVHFPLVNIRRDVVSKWKMKHFFGDTSEEITVPELSDEDGYYTVFLNEIPDIGTTTSDITTTAPKISGLVELRGEPIDSKTLRLKLTPVQFFVNYQTGQILFHPAQAGKTFLVDYWGKGSLVEADDINYLYDKIVEVEKITDKVKPEFKSFEIERYEDGVLEVGSSFPISPYQVKFKWEINNPDKLEPNSIKIENVTTGNVIGSTIPDLGEITISFQNSFTFSEPYELIFRISAVGINGEEISKEFKLIWVDKIYWGTLPNKDGITPDQIKEIGNFKLFDSTAKNQNVVLNFLDNPNQFKIIAVPRRYSISDVIDKKTNLEFVMDDPTSLDVTNNLGLRIPYLIYCSTYPIGPLLSLIIKMGDEENGN